jgi:hypothetical protein
MPVSARKEKNKTGWLLIPAQPKPSARRLKPVIRTRLRPSLSASRPAIPLVSAATIIMTEKRLPAAIAESENVSRISGSAMPSVATIIDGIKLEQGTIQTDRRLRCRDTDGFCSSMFMPT